jgi:predicted DNA-binding transcriptional regulator AlpA
MQNFNLNLVGMKHLMPIRDVQFALGESRATVYSRINRNSDGYEERHPKPLKIKGSTRWLSSEIRDYIDELARERDNANGIDRHLLSEVVA